MIAAWARRLLGWKSPSRAAAEGVSEGFPDGLNPPPSTVPFERVEALLRAYDLAERLKKTEACYAARDEGQRCVTADVRWSGRELKRLLDALTTHEERRAVGRLRTARAWAAVRETPTKGQP